MRRAGFALLETIVAIGVVAMLVGVAALRVEPSVERGKTAQLLHLFDALRGACAAYRADVGSYAHEHVGYASDQHQLSLPQRFPGWRGPYLESPLNVGDNPFGGGVQLFDRLDANGSLPGFDLDADGASEVQGEGNLMYLTRVSSSEAFALDGVLDRDVPGPWQDTGRVRYAARTEELFVLLLR